MGSKKLTKEAVLNYINGILNINADFSSGDVSSLSYRTKYVIMVGVGTEISSYLGEQIANIGPTAFKACDSVESMITLVEVSLL